MNADTEGNRTDSLEIVKAFNVIKALIWSCSTPVDDEGNAVERDYQFIDMNVLLDHMKEVKLLLDLHNAGSTYGISEKSILRRLTLVKSNEIGGILNTIAEE